MGSRDAEHTQWNLEHGLQHNQRLAMCCPRCGRPHIETLTSDPAEPDYFHHVHQCTNCGLRFDVYLRTRSTHEASASLVTCVDRANAIISLIARDIEGRSGIGNAFEEIDEETRDEMLDGWRDDILKVLNGS